MSSIAGSSTLGWSPTPREAPSPPAHMRGFARAGNGFAVSQQRAWQNESCRMFQQQPRAPPTAAPMDRGSKQWQEMPELKVLVSRLPPTVTTKELWQLFHEEGNIDFIRINTEYGSDRRAVDATITFKPPPQFDFWTDKMWTMKSPKYGVQVVDVSIDRSYRPRMITSPVNKARRYPEFTTMSPLALGFGVMTGEVSMLIKKYTVANPIGELLFQVDLKTRAIVVTFTNRELRNESQSPGQYSRFKFLIHFDELKDIKRTSLQDGGNSALTISLDHPPQFFCQGPHNVAASHKDDSLIWSERDSWWRATDIVDVVTLASKEVSLSKVEEPILDMGRWISYMMVLPDDILNSAIFEELTQALRDFNIEISGDDDFNRINGTDSPVEVWKLIDRPVTDRNDEMHCLMEGGQFFNLPFEVRYQLEVCISHSILEEHSITAAFLEKLNELVVKEKYTAQSILEFLAVRGKRVYDPMMIFKDNEALSHNIRSNIPVYCAWARKATITPTTMYLSTPTVEISNRVIRKYADYGDRFIRVQFAEENTHRRVPQSADKNTNDALYTRVFRTLKNGIRIGDRHYKFLAYGNSQLREHGAYFFCQPEGNDELSCANIRKWMGNFKDIRNPAKYAARLGQCFSTTRAMRNRRIVVNAIPDVERNGHCFTDGVGKISPFLMKLIQEELRLLDERSVVQFRLGGCKGILAMCPDLAAYEVQIRKSQVKFLAEYNGLEIIRPSQYGLATLNRQTITILSCLGVEDEVFHRKLQEQLADYQDAVTNPDKADELLRRYIDQQHSTIAIAAMVHNGFMRSGEPFVNSLLHLWRAWSIKYLKEKARIIIEKGAFVFGCTDETQTLRGHINKDIPAEGDATPLEIDDLPQIFLQVSDPNDPRHTTVIEGVCVVGRNPSHHPGDIRIVQAIDVPALHHLKDVVVFSQLGDRDVPGMCSGGDLDGDDFFVIWDKEFIPAQWNAEPMVLPETEPNTLRRPVRIEDVMGVFVMYMKNDTLGQISNAHLAWADQLPDSVKSETCKKLAQLASKAVDYVKSGTAAVMEKELRPRQWPHFMEKERGVYRSHRIVGQLYDKVVLIDFKPQYEMPFDKRVLDAFHEHPEMLKKARQLKSQYDSAMLRVMAQYGVQTEFEVWTSFLMSKAIGSNEYEQARVITEVADAMKDKFRSACIEAAGGSDFKTLAPFVAAMYKVASEEMEYALKECKMLKTVGGRQVPKREMTPWSMPLISFPWLFPNKLGRIATNSEPQDLLGLDTETMPKKVRPKKTAGGGSELEEVEDIVQTADGVVHRGELLDLFNEVEHSDDEKKAAEPMPLNHTIRLGGNSGNLESMAVESDEGVVATSERRIPSRAPVRNASDPQTQDARRPSLIDVKSDHDENLQLVETEDSKVRRSSGASSAVDDLAEMQQSYGSLNDLAALEEAIAEEDWEMLVKIQSKKSALETSKQKDAPTEEAKPIPSAEMTMSDFDKLPVGENITSLPAKTPKMWNSTTSDSDRFFTRPTQAFPQLQSPLPTPPRKSTPPPKLAMTSNSPIDTVTPKQTTFNDLYDATPRPRPQQPNTPVLARVQQRFIPQPIDSLPSPQEPIAKPKPASKGKGQERSADEDAESRKTPFFAPKGRVVVQKSTRVSPPPVKSSGLLDFLKSNNGSQAKQNDGQLHHLEAAFSLHGLSGPAPHQDENQKPLAEGPREFLKANNGSGAKNDQEKTTASSDAPKDEPPVKEEGNAKLSTAKEEELLEWKEEDSIVRMLAEEGNAEGKVEKSDADKLADMIGVLEL